jgi:DNA excision repair protein ERCC-4
MIILRDSREQLGYDFDRFEGVTVHRAALESGDYSLPGLENIVAVERKELNDLINCLCHDRERFKKELHRLRPYALKAVVIEATPEDIARGRYKSQMKPQAALQSCFAFMVKYGVNFFFAGNRQGGEYATHALLWKYQQELEKQLSAINKQTGRLENGNDTDESRNNVGSCKVTIT